MEFVRTGAKNVLCNEMFPVRIPDDRSSLQRNVTKCPSNVTCFVLDLNFVMFSDAMQLTPEVNVSHSIRGCRSAFFSS